MTEDANDTALLETLSALANPHRLSILAMLGEGRQYVSQLARDMQMSRPLLHMHLRRLEQAGLVHGTLELSSDGKAMRFYEATDFSIEITPESVRSAVTNGKSKEPEAADAPGKQQGDDDGRDT